MMTRNLIPPQAGDRFVIDTLHYAALFVVGIYLAREKGRIAGIFSCFSLSRKIGIATVSAFLYIFGYKIWTYIAYKVVSFEVDTSGDWFTALGAAGIIVVSLNSESCRRILLWAPVRALGKMSYRDSLHKSQIHSLLG
jgi:peptidoglycan/LPS O-acetylase OafA/YrhL